jgi:alpha,alpha-trehalase
MFRELLKEGNVEVYQSSVDLIMNLRHRGYKVAVASSSRNCTEVLEAAGIAGLFDAQVDGIDIESLDLKGKPDPDMFLEAARRLAVDHRRCVVLEDAISGVQAGRSGGFGLVIGVNRHKQRKALQEAGADLVVDDLSEIDVEVEIRELPDAITSFHAIEERMGEKRVAVFLDYDGTLTPIVSRPEDAVLAAEMRERLLQLSTHCQVAIVSGRGLEDVRGFVAIDDIYYAGSHGFEMAGPNGYRRDHEEAEGYLPALDEVEAELRERLKDIPGSQVERKKFTVAIHYRNVEEGQAGAVGEIVDLVHQDHPEFRKTEGK